MRSYRKEVNMLKLIGKAYKTYKTYKTVKKVINDVDDMASRIKIPNSSELFIQRKAKLIISNLENKYKIDVPENIFIKLLEIGIKLAKGEKVSTDKRDLCYMIVVYLLGEVKDIYYYIEKVFKKRNKNKR